MNNRILSLFLAFAITITALGFSAFAQEDPAEYLDLGISLGLSTTLLATDALSVEHTSSGQLLQEVRDALGTKDAANVKTLVLSGDAALNFNDLMALTLRLSDDSESALFTGLEALDLRAMTLETVPSFLCSSPDQRNEWLTSVQLPDHATTIAYGAFYDCRALVSVSLPDTLQIIESAAFFSCGQLESVAFPEGISIIGSDAFLGCSSLIVLEFPESLQSIGMFSFLECHLKDVTFTSATPPLVEFGAFAVSDEEYGLGFSPSVTFHCPAAWGEWFNEDAFIGHHQVASNGNNETLVTDIAISPSSLELKVNETASLSAGVFPQDAKNQRLTWTSSDEIVVSVDESGFVFAYKAGTATVTVTAQDGSETRASCAITVTTDAIPVAAITLMPAGLDLIAGSSASLTASVSPSDATDKTMRWESNNAAVATVDASGRVTAAKPGSAEITATAQDGNGVTATCDVAVRATQKLVSSIQITPTSSTIKPGEAVLLNTTVSPADAEDKKLTWTSSDNKIAQVDASGLVNGIKAGTARITATASDGSNVSSSCAITVTKATVVSMNSPFAILKVGDTPTLTATIRPETASSKGVYWSCDNTSIITVDQKGNITALKKGIATVFAQARDGSGAYAYCEIAVLAPIK